MKKTFWRWMWSEAESVLQQGTVEAAGSSVGTFLFSPGSVTEEFPELGIPGWDPADAHTASPKSPGLSCAEQRRRQAPAGFGDPKASDIPRGDNSTWEGLSSFSAGDVQERRLDKQSWC